MGRNKLSLLLVLPLLGRLTNMDPAKQVNNRHPPQNLPNTSDRSVDTQELTGLADRPDIPYGPATLISLLKETKKIRTRGPTTEQVSFHMNSSILTFFGGCDKENESMIPSQSNHNSETKTDSMRDIQSPGSFPINTSPPDTRILSTGYSDKAGRYRRWLTFDYPFSESNTSSENWSEPLAENNSLPLPSSSTTSHLYLNSTSDTDRQTFLERTMLDFLGEVQSQCRGQLYCDARVWDVVPYGGICYDCNFCSCSDSCYTEENCCLGKLLSDVHHELEDDNPHCHKANFATDPIRAELDMQITWEYYVMEDTCQEGWSNKSVHEKCVNFSDRDMQSQWPVWSAGSGLTYRNKHCALCNGQSEDQLQQWDFSILCTMPIHLQLSSRMEDIVKDIVDLPGCLVNFIPPPNVRPKHCSRRVYKKLDNFCSANATRENRGSFRRFLQTCDAYFDDNTVNEHPNLTNLFCALCTHHMEGDVCTGQSVDTPFPFVLLISAKALRNVTSATTAQCYCSYDEVYDKYESRCRKVQCSLSKKLDNGRCVHWVNQSQGEGYELNLRLTPVDSGEPSVLETIQLLTDINLEIGNVFDREIAFFNTYFFNLFYVVYHVKRDRRSSTSRVSSDQVVLEAIDLKIQLVVQTQTDTQGMENNLMRLSRYKWNFGLWPFQTNIRNSVRTEATDTETSRYEFKHQDLIPLVGNFSEYSVNLTDVYMGNVLLLHTPSNYHRVQDTLNCPKVSFRLKKVMTAAAVDTLTEKSANADHKTARDTGHLLHSVNANTGEVVLSVDPETGTAYHHPSRHNISFQYVELLQDGVVLVCAEQLYGTHTISSGPLVLHKFFSTSMIYVSVACQSLSVLCLFLVFFTYCLFAELRTLPGKNTMGLVASLLIAMLLFEVGVARVETPVVCIIVGVVIHLSLLSAFTWMVLCSTCMYRIFTRLLVSRHDQAAPQASLFRKYVTLSVLVPVVIVTLTLLGNWLAHRGDCDLDLGYGRGICYLSNTWSLILASVLPICVAVVINIGLFVCTLRSLRSTSRVVRFAHRKEHYQLLVYIRMSTLTGINWLAGPLTAVIDSVIVWYIFIVLCGLQGLYVFVAFVCNQRVLSLYGSLLGCREGKLKKEDESRDQTQPTNDLTSSSGVHTISFGTNME